MSAILCAHQVALQYPQNNWGLGPTTLSLRPGEVGLISGDSGCGKSTLARCLTGLIPHLHRGKLSGEARIEAFPRATRLSGNWQSARALSSKTRPVRCWLIR